MNHNILQRSQFTDILNAVQPPLRAPHIVVNGVQGLIQFMRQRDRHLPYGVQAIHVSQFGIALPCMPFHLPRQSHIIDDADQPGHLPVQPWKSRPMENHLPIRTVGQLYRRFVQLRSGRLAHRFSKSGN